MISRFRISGQSMSPSLNPGDEVVTIKLPNWLLRPGMMVVAKPAHAEFIVKNLLRTSGDKVVLASENAATSSRYVGVEIDRSCVAGVVIWTRRLSIQTDT
ncbi:MAG: S24/S26 family peptidase [Pseudomonadota bacterium]